jgi:two-component system phosphate regulon response regulator PhoB
VFAPVGTATVLVVEDDPHLREAYRSFLTASRYRVLVASDGLAALTTIDHERPQVVVLDLGLPRVSGWDVYRDLRSRPETENLAIIIVTGNELRDIHPRDLSAFMQKPVAPEELASAVDKALHKH